MAVDRIPPGLLPASGSLTFTEDTIPPPLLREHALGEGRWGVLHLFEGSIDFVDIPSDESRLISAPDAVVIRPCAPHRVALTGRMSCRIDFFREPDSESPHRTPGAYADNEVRQSLDRCEANGDFGRTFYDIFLQSSSQVAEYFAGTDLARQRIVLRDSVLMLATRDVSDEEARQELDHLGRQHSRDCRNVLPVLYELWLDSVCLTVRQLDPRWSEELEGKWRVRLRPGLQIIMAAY